MKRCIKLVTAMFLTASLLSFAQGAVDNKSVENLLFMEIPVVVTASMVEQTIDEVPGSVTVITENQIKLYGLKYLMDAFNIIPGFQACILEAAGYSLTVRNYRNASAHVLIMLDGYPLNNMNLHGNEHFAYYPLENVKQIEIVRGPGSSLYGTDAFSAVINIITKKNKRTEVSLSAGEFSNKEINAVYQSDSKDDFNYAVSCDYMDEDGDKLRYNSDYLTGYPKIGGGTISYAPCERNKMKRRLGTNISLQYKDLSFTVNHTNSRQNWSEGWLNVMTPGDEYRTLIQTYGRLKYLYNISDNASLTYMGSYSNESIEVYGLGFPAGFSWISFPNRDKNGDGTQDYWPNGAILRSYNMFDKTSNEIISMLDYDLHKLTFGALYEERTASKSESGGKDANMLTNDLSLYPSGTIITGRDPRNFLTNEGDKEIISALYGQDIYKIHDKLSLIAGIRYDKNSKSGDAYCPRIAFVCDAFEDHVVKLSYGKAFCSPYPAQQYMTAMGFNGNPNLKPQTIQTYEISLQNIMQKRLHYVVDFFYSRISDGIMIDYNRNPVYWNADELTFKGCEMEATWKINSMLDLWGNYSITDSYDETNKIKYYGISNIGNAGFVLQAVKNLSFSTYAHFSGEYTRRPSDKHTDTLSGWVTINSAVVYSGIRNVEISLIARNLTDSLYYYPNSQASILKKASSDWPYDGRQILLKLSCKY